MALTDKLTAIGDAIRAKTGETALLKLDDMPTAIAGIQTGSGDGDTLKSYFKDELVEYKMPDGITILPDNAFYNKKALQKLDLNQVTQLGTACFQNCTNLTEVDFSKIEKLNGANILNGSGVTVIDLSSVTNVGISSGGYTRYFQSADKLVEVKNFHPVKAEAYLFFSCPSLKILDLSLLTETGTSSFYNCGFEEIVLPSATNIGGSFGGNKACTKIDIGANCTRIQAEAFKDCTNVTAVIVRATTPPTLSNVNAFNFIPTTAGDHGKYIYVPAESYNTYQSATNWTSFVGSGVTFRKIEDYPEITGG